MKHPWRIVADRAGPARAENRLLRANDFGLNKKIAECRMQRVGGRRCEDDFCVARYIDGSSYFGPVGDADSAQFDVILRRNSDLGMGVQLAAAGAELGPRLRENRFVALGPLERRLIGIGPELPARRVADVTERPPVVAGGVFAPARDCHVFPAAVTAACVRDHHVVSAVGQQLHFRHRRIRIAEDAHRRFRTVGSYG